MVNQDLDILIMRYLNNDLNTEEKAVFEKRMSSDESLQETVKTFSVIEKGINVYAKSQLKIDLQNTHKKLEDAKSFSNYKPSIKPSGGFSLTGFIIKTILVLAVASAGLIYFDKMPIKHPFIKDVKQKMDEIVIQKQVVTTDTIWHTVKSSRMTSDTVYISTQEEMDAFKKKLKNKDSNLGEAENEDEWD